MRSGLVAAQEADIVAAQEADIVAAQEADIVAAQEADIAGTTHQKPLRLYVPEITQFPPPHTREGVTLRGEWQIPQPRTILSLLSDKLGRLECTNIPFWLWIIAPSIVYHSILAYTACCSAAGRSEAINDTRSI